MAHKEKTAQNQEKKPYHSPVFEEIGDVKELTQTNTTSGGFDGGSFPNVYAS